MPLIELSEKELEILIHSLDILKTEYYLNEEENELLNKLKYKIKRIGEVK